MSAILPLRLPRSTFISAKTKYFCSIRVKYLEKTLSLEANKTIVILFLRLADVAVGLLNHQPCHAAYYGISGYYLALQCLFQFERKAEERLQAVAGVS